MEGKELGPKVSYLKSGEGAAPGNPCSSRTGRVPRLRTQQLWHWVHMVPPAGLCVLQSHRLSLSSQNMAQTPALQRSSHGQVTSGAPLGSGVGCAGSRLFVPFSRYLFSGCFHCQIHVTHLPAGDEQQSVRFFRRKLTKLSAEVGLSGAALGLLWEARGRGEPWPAGATVGTRQPGPAWSALGLRRPQGACTVDGHCHRSHTHL